MSLLFLAVVKKLLRAPILPGYTGLTRPRRGLGI
jgi:hypothetical protein